MEKEIIFVTSLNHKDFYRNYGPFNYKMPITVMANVQSCGAARNIGGQIATGDTLLYMDCHVCFDQQNVDQLLKTLEDHKNAIVAPAVKAINFPSCIIENESVGHGVAFRFTNNPFEWIWLPGERLEKEFTVPFVCGCAFSMKKDLFNVLNSVGGFLGGHTGLSWEEEKSMRLWRMGYPTFSEPRSIFGHYYKGYANHTGWDQHSTAGYYESRVAGFYINVFNKDLWDYIENMLLKSWGIEYTKNLELAKKNYSWIRAKMLPFANKIDETWFLRIR
jgi:hypothetical protein